jgi:sulfopropanediol 3-dehydrogenase
MPTWLKRGGDVEQRAEAGRQVRATVESILAGIETRSDWPFRWQQGAPWQGTTPRVDVAE